MRKLTLEIELGNDAMETIEDVALALSGIARKMENFGSTDPCGDVSIRDDNGNLVGAWRFTD